MDSESPLPAKRMRTSLNGNLQLTECVREFKLPRQFPSMVTKVNCDVANEKIKVRPNFNTAVTCLTKTPIQTKIVTNQEIPAATIVRKIKLKGKDGRDLGEVNVQDLPQNIQGKTITLAKNNLIKSPEIVSPADKSKGITIGVLTPVNLLKTEKSYANKLLSLTCVNQEQKEIVDAGKDKKKTMIIEQKQMSAVMDQHGRPQVLVFQSGKSWHMVKIATTAPALGADKGNNIVIGKLPQIQNCGKATLLQAKEQNPNVGAKESVQNGLEKSMTVDRLSSTNNTGIIVKRWPQCSTSDSAAERYKSKSPVVVESGETRPKIEISRVFGTFGNKSVSQVQPITQIQTTPRLSATNGKSLPNAERSPQNNLTLRKDVMVVLPSDIPTSLGSDSEFTTVHTVDSQPLATNRGDYAHGKSGKKVDSDKLPMFRDFIPANTVTRKSAESGEKDNISSHLNILTKALSTVEDKELRAKALKALAECGIGVEKLVPICPESERRPMKDSDTQTTVFGIIEPKHFVQVTPESPAVDRIRTIERKAPQKIGHIVGNPHPQELSLSCMNDMNWLTPGYCSELNEMVEGYLEGREEVSEVRKIFTKSNSVPPRLVSQLEEDFLSYKKYDENGLLNIHRAVINEDLPVITRLLKVLKAVNESPDIPTADDETSLELAVRYEVSPKIIKLLLDHGAEPTSSEIGHDSALIIASKKSLPILKDLIPYVTTRKSLDNYDSLGFTAMHYCAQNNNKSGVIELARASADVNTRDRRSGRTPLFHAIENEHIELAQLLLDKGAQPNIACYSGHTVFALVEEGKHYSLVESLNRVGKNSI